MATRPPGILLIQLGTPDAPTAEALRPGPYTFPDAHRATAFVTQAVEALMVLGCDVHAS